MSVHRAAAVPATCLQGQSVEAFIGLWLWPNQLCSPNTRGKKQINRRNGMPNSSEAVWNSFTRHMAFVTDLSSRQDVQISLGMSSKDWACAGSFPSIGCCWPMAVMVCITEPGWGGNFPCSYIQILWLPYSADKGLNSALLGFPQAALQL